MEITPKTINDFIDYLYPKKPSRRFPAACFSYESPVSASNHDSITFKIIESFINLFISSEDTSNSRRNERTC